MRPVRPCVALASVLAAANVLPAQNPPIDLNLWTTEHVNGSGPWVVAAPRLFAYSTNTAITDVSTLYSDFPVTLLEFTMRVDPAGGDDDLPGFLLGWQPGDGANPTTADYVVVDWKRATQAFQDWGTANVGLAVSQQRGAFTRGYGGGPIDLWSHTRNCTELARGNRFGSIGWEFGRDYRFRVLYTPASVDVWVDDVPELSVTGTFRPGRFACYQFSQSRTEYQFPLTGSFASFGNGCAGTAGTPYLFAPLPPYAGESLPIVVADVTPSALAVVVLGLSNTAWLGNPLPLGLAPLGAPGCQAYVSGDVFVPAANFNGTAFLNLLLPATLAPSQTPSLFVQALATDPAANALGLVFSNAGAMAIGVR